jgi:hypothetical protein
MSVSVHVTRCVVEQVTSIGGTVPANAPGLVGLPTVGLGIVEGLGVDDGC